MTRTELETMWDAEDQVRALKRAATAELKLAQMRFWFWTANALWFSVVVILILAFGVLWAERYGAWIWTKTT